VADTTASFRNRTKGKVLPIQRTRCFPRDQFCKFDLDNEAANPNSSSAIANDTCHLVLPHAVEEDYNFKVEIQSTERTRLGSSGDDSQQQATSRHQCTLMDTTIDARSAARHPLIKQNDIEYICAVDLWRSKTRVCTFRRDGPIPGCWSEAVLGPGL